MRKQIYLHDVYLLALLGMNGISGLGSTPDAARFRKRNIFGDRNGLPLNGHGQSSGVRSHFTIARALERRSREASRRAPGDDARLAWRRRRRW